MQLLDVYAVQRLGISLESRRIDSERALGGADESFKQFIETKPRYGCFWSEWQNAFDEPFRSYVTNEFAKKDQKK
jgi:hypothetical protein